MRKIIVLSMLSLDGVMQAPGGPEEDTSGGFQYGGWVAPMGDELYSQALRKQLKPADLLLGRKTYDIFAGYWPQHGDFWTGVNDVTKYVLSNTLKNPEWNNSIVLQNVADIEKLKNTEGGDIQVHGSGELVQLLLKHDLVDELWLKIHPLILGKGKKLFNDEALARTFALTEHTITTKGVIIANYQRIGPVQTGTIEV
ncbi:dihydrofolate reductase family protein [Deminuibacter soli]|uniref:Dihydrofolate reductase n=1 Tax=Deminuibacter soli TaxID=2291815 RepID=A0A3E1NG12_9BACT|nr:dihydrofolate reductase family protein [Deminuibacter soli]RFM26761.1 dihydrofolate reductase [Deminuibacter soli]